MNRILKTLFFYVCITGGVQAQAAEPVGELGRCYDFDASGEPQLVLTIYGGIDSNEILGVRRGERSTFAASGHYGYNVLKENHLIAFDPDNIPVFELSSPRRASWVSSFLTFAQYAPTGETTSSEELECYDRDISPMIRPVIVTGSGRVTIWSAGEVTVELAMELADQDALRQCRQKLGPDAKTERFGAHRTTFNWGVATASASYRCLAN